MHRRSFLCAALAAPWPAAAEAESGFTSLFDGKTLHGWSIQQGPETAFYVQEGDIVVHEGANFPTWLRSDREYENFDLRLEYFVKGWCNSGIYLHAPQHGPNTECGLKINIFQKQDKPPLPVSMGAVFPLVAPKLVNVKNQGEWNTMRVLMNWPRLQVWTNDEMVQDLDLSAHPELQHRLRRGYLGLESLSYPIRFRNLRIRELPDSEKWDVLYRAPADFAKWRIAEGNATWETLGPVLRSDGLGYLATRERYQDFLLHMYVRASRHSNGGIYFRVGGDAPANMPHYEIQIHDVEGAVYPTGSLYEHQRAKYPRIEPEQWFLLQLLAQGKRCLVRINGETVVDAEKMDRVVAGPIMLQAHQRNKWLEYKDIKVRRL